MSSSKKQNSRSSSSSSDLYRAREESLERRSGPATRSVGPSSTAVEPSPVLRGRGPLPFSSRIGRTAVSPSHNAARSERQSGESATHQGHGERHGIKLPTRLRGESSERDEAVSAFASPRGPLNERRTDTAPARITDLPNEILIRIANDLDLRSVNNLRLANRRFLGVANDYLRERMSLLYLHPTRHSVKRVLEICSNGLYAGKITQLCLLGDPMWRAILGANAAYRAGRVDGNYQHFAARSHWCNSPMGGQTFKAWPRSYELVDSVKRSPAPVPSPERGDSRRKSKKPVLGTNSPGPRSSEKAGVLPNKGKKKDTPSDLQPEDPGADFEACYKPLIDALARLLNLRELGYMASATYAGLNAVTANQIESHAHATTAGIINGNDSRDTAFLGRRSDADVFYGLLASPRLQFTKLSLRNELPLHENVARHMPLPMDTTNRFSRPMSRLTQLDLSIDCGWRENESQRMYKRLIQGSRHSLQWLRIRLIYNNISSVPWARYLRVPNPLEMGDEDHSEPLGLRNLQHLEFIFVNHPLADESSRHPSGRWLRPAVICTVGDRFWVPCLETLTTLKFHHVVTLHLEKRGPKGQYGIPETIKYNLEYLKEYLRTHRHRLKRFDWVVPAFRHHPRCRAASDSEIPLDGHCESWGGPNWYCGTYSNKTVMPSDLNEMKRVANELGVEFDSESETWNFGDYIMRDIEDRKAKERDEAES